MAKVKVCLDAGCTKYIHLDDGRTIETPNERCTVNPAWGKKEQGKWDTIVKGTTEAVKVNRPVFQKVKEGDSLDF